MRRLMERYPIKFNPMKIEDQIQQEVAKEALKHIDIKKMVQKALPQIEKAVVNGLVRSFENYDWENFIFDEDVVPCNEIARFLKKKLSAALSQMK